MSEYKIFVGGSEVDKYINQSSVLLTTAKNKTPSMLSFTLIFPLEIPLLPTPYFSGDYMVDNSDYVFNNDNVSFPITGQDVVMTIDSVVVFGGKVIRSNKSRNNAGMYQYKIKCQDYSRIAQMGEPVAEIYKNKTVLEIITSIVNNYTIYKDFDISNVNCDIVIDYFFIDHKTLWEILSDLSSRTAYEFYISPNKEIFFYLGGSIIGESVSETNGSYINNSLSIDSQSDKIFNMIIIQGGEYDGSEIVSETIISSGSTNIDISGRYSGVSVTVDGISKKVGTYGINNESLPTAFDCLYDFNGRVIVFDNSTKPVSGQEIIVSGNQKIRVIVQSTDDASVSKNGLIPKKIKDVSLKTKESAFQMANAELSKYAIESENGGFQTRNKTFRAGQRIGVSYMGGYGEYDIQSTSTSFIGENIHTTNVTFATSEILDTISVLTSLIDGKNSSDSAEIILEVLKQPKEILGVLDTIRINYNINAFNLDLSIDEVLNYYQDRPIEYVYGDFIFPSNINDYRRNASYEGSIYQ